MLKKGQKIPRVSAIGEYLWQDPTATDDEVALATGVLPTSVHNWRDKHPNWERSDKANGQSRLIGAVEGQRLFGAFDPAKALPSSAQLGKLLAEAKARVTQLEVLHEAAIRLEEVAQSPALEFHIESL